MNENGLVRYSLFFAAYVLLQGLVLNHIDFLGSINPYLYVLFMLRLPINANKTLVLLAGFALGLAVDIMSGTPGMNAAATTLLGLLKPHADKIFFERKDKNVRIVPSAKGQGVGAFARYAICLVLIHHFTFFLVNAWNLEVLPKILLKCGESSLFTLLLIWIIEYYNYSRKENA